MSGLEPDAPAPVPRHRLIVVILLVMTALLTWWLFKLSNEHPVDLKGRATTERGPLHVDEQQNIDLFKDGAPSVVYITSLQLRRDRISMNVMEIPQGTGSGFVWDDSGHIVTNFHVIAEAEAVSVTLWDQSVLRAKVVGVNADKDLAVLRVEVPSEKLRPIPVGTSNDLQVGQKVLAIGNPFGFDHTLTTGVISGLGREILSKNNRPITGVIQTDAAINPGNSGGPLLDSAGRLIGVNTAIFSPTGAYAGLGFAVPVDTVNRLVPQLIRYGRVIKPGLGVGVFEDAFVRRLGLRGVLIRVVGPNSAAAKAGLRGTRQDVFGKVILGDIILAVGDDEISTSIDLFRALDQYKVGDKVTLAVGRGQSKLSVQLTLQALN